MKAPTMTASNREVGFTKAEMADLIDRHSKGAEIVDLARPLDLEPESLRAAIFAFVMSRGEDVRSVMKAGQRKGGEALSLHSL